MNESASLEILRAQGCRVAEPDPRTGFVRIWLRSGEEAVDVEIGRELDEFAEGRLTIEDILDRRDDEALPVE